MTSLSWSLIVLRADPERHFLVNFQRNIISIIVWTNLTLKISTLCGHWLRNWITAIKLANCNYLHQANSISNKALIEKHFLQSKSIEKGSSQLLFCLTLFLNFINSKLPYIVSNLPKIWYYFYFQQLLIIVTNFLYLIKDKIIFHFGNIMLSILV